MKIDRNELIFALIAITLGVLTRTFLDLGQNIEMVTAFAIVSGYFFTTKKLAYSVPLITMIISDIIIGNTSIFLFTWTGFLIAPTIGSLLRKLVNKARDREFTFGVVGSQAFGIISTLFFFVWTNLGVWLIGDMYVKDISGLIHSYINGIPFLLNQLLGNLIIVPLVFILGYAFFKMEILNNPIKKFSLKK